jgi:uncharacterized protein
VKGLFVDTSAWCAIEDQRDMHHAVCLQFKDEIVGIYALVTTDYVLDETYTLLLMNLGYQRTVGFHQKIEQMERAGILHIEPITRDLCEEAWETFEQFNKDKQWSFTDCSSRVVMKHQGIEEVFALDHHFEQMGFIRKP